MGPYDGLLLAKTGDIPVHACLGLPLYDKSTLLGVLTFDSLNANAFSRISADTLSTLQTLCSAHFKTALELAHYKHHAQHSSALVQELTRDALTRDGGEIIGQSPVMQTLKNEIKLVAASNFSVLVLGETGVGKELVARNIHLNSARKDQPLIHLNCASLPENLAESEFFGHAKGSFTGAQNARQGKFQLADGGTLFLDEIGDMPMTLQVKLLRALQERQIRPVGSSKHVDIDVRIISATHKDLHKEMEESTFREDLYYRLNVVNLKLPSLKSRSEDIPLLARSLLQQSAQRHGVNVSQFSDDAMQQLVTSSWPGNVRQLVNVVEQCVALTQTPVIPLHLVEQALSATKQSWPTLTEARDAFEQQYLHKLLKMTDGNVTRAAELAGRNRTDMHKLMKKHELDAADFR